MSPVAIRRMQYVISALLLPLAGVALVAPSPGATMEHRWMIAAALVALAIFLSPLGDMLSLNPAQTPSNPRR